MSYADCSKKVIRISIEVAWTSTRVTVPVQANAILQHIGET